ncbi:MAG: tetratricopeptide repeat protein [Gammaproteobacteria bacterium]|nr:MAG: tetratricopeptide repeat protein [Gammaproteobacteria bacterium]
MAEHLSEEEQLESLKRWWKENGLSTVIIVVLAVGGYFGWDLWKGHRQAQAEAAAVVYQDMMDAAAVQPGETLSPSRREQAVALAEELIDEFSGSQYARYAALLLASLEVQDGDLEGAAEQLHWAEDGADDGLSLIIKLRLARIEAAKGNLDAAIAMLNGVEARSMASAYAEAIGDFQLMKGDKEAAYKAYREALQSLVLNDNQTRAIIELKLNHVAPTVETESAVTEKGEGA